MLEQKDYIQQLFQLGKMFPEDSVLQKTRKHIVKKGLEGLSQPFDLETGVLTGGEFSGKTLDEVYQIDPFYIIRMVYYNSMTWDPLHKLFFVRWTSDNRKKD